MTKMFEKEIRTYSRLRPVSVFKSSAALVPAYPDPADRLNVRESRINDKTLGVDPFENTFDRILTEDRIASREGKNETSGGENSDDVFKKPVPGKSQRNLRNKPTKRHNKDQDDQRIATKNHHSKKYHGVKRKKIIDHDSDQESDDSDSQDSGDENSIKVVKNSKKKPKKEQKKRVTSPVKNLPLIIVHSTDTTSIEDLSSDPAGESNEAASIEIDADLRRINSDSIDFGDDLCKSKEESISHILRKKLLHNISTSTPREHKLKMVVNMQHLSPIALDKENRLSFEDERFTAVNMDEELLERDRDCNLNDERRAKQVTDETASENNKENDDVNNSSISELLRIDEANEINKSLPEYTAQDGKNNELIRTFVESPLMFDDTQDNGSKSIETHATTMQRLKELSENLAQDSTQQSKIAAPANDSSYYPHDWSDDYNSSYEYCGEQNNVNKEQELTKDECASNVVCEPLNNEKQSDENKVNDINVTIPDSISENLNGTETKSSLLSNNSDQSDRDLEKSLQLKLSSKSVESDCEFDNSSQSSQMNQSGRSQSPVILQDNLTNSQVTEHDESSQIDQSPNFMKSQMSEEQNFQNSLILSQENLGDNIIDDEESNKFSQNQDTSQHHLEVDSEMNQLREPSQGQPLTLPQSNTKNQSCSDHEEEEEQLNLSSKSFEDQLQIALKSSQIENDIEQDTTEQMDVSEKTDKSNFDIRNQNSHDRVAPEEQTKMSKEVDSNVEADASKFDLLEHMDVAEEIDKSDVDARNQNSDDRVAAPAEEMTVSDHSNRISEVSKLPAQVDDTFYESNGEISEKRPNYNKYNCKEVVVCIEKLDSQTMKSLLKSVRDANKIKLKGKAVGSKKKLSKNAEKEASWKKKKNTNKEISGPKNNLSNQSREDVSSPNLSNTSLGRQGNERNLKAVKSKASEWKEQSVNNDSAVKYKNISEKFKIKDSFVAVTKLDVDTIAKLQPPSDDKSMDKRRSVVILERLDESVKENVADNVDGGNLNDSCNELRSKLNDPSTITMRRKSHRKLDRPALAILDEDEEEEEEYHADQENAHCHPLDSRQSQAVFLKPGKLWARSLSIINHFHSGQNLDEFAAGRGQNWRHSVQSVLKMQSDANRASANAERESSAAFAAPQLSQRESHRPSTLATSPNRYSKRFSIRMIPSGKRSTLTEDLMNSRRVSERTASISRKASLEIRRDTLIETEDDLIKSARDIILKRCNQLSYLPFGESFPDSYIAHCRKIGEGVYGEVFLYDDGEEKSVIKIIPIEGSEPVNCEPQKKFHEILSEIIIAEELHKLRFEEAYNTNGFVGVNRIVCVIGKYPERLVELWRRYDQERKSENDCPSMFHDQQLYIILELAHGGQDLEAYQFQNASQSYAIFLQTALTLAVAEKSLEFEHRDLHWGNLLISKTDDAETVYKLGQGQVAALPTKGVKVSVIDFTLSRMSYKGCKIFNDLAADPTLFEAQGEYQFDIYRMMKDKVNNDWQQFDPYTNILWLDYTLDKMITAVRYKKKTTKVHKTAIEEMKALRQEILQYRSTYELISNCSKIRHLIGTENTSA